MALIACPDCGRQISDAATACIGCGRPMEPAGAVVDALLSAEGHRCGACGSRNVQSVLVMHEAGTTHVDAQGNMVAVGRGGGPWGAGVANGVATSTERTPLAARLAPLNSGRKTTTS